MDSIEQFTAILHPFLEYSEDPETLVSASEYKLLQGHFSDAFETFSHAEAIIGDSRPDLYFRMGLALLNLAMRQVRTSSSPSEQKI